MDEHEAQELAHALSEVSRLLGCAVRAEIVRTPSGDFVGWQLALAAEPDAGESERPASGA